MIDFSNGFVVEKPALVIPWGISEPELVALVGARSLREVVRGYCTLRCSTGSISRSRSGSGTEREASGHVLDGVAEART